MVHFWGRQVKYAEESNKELEKELWDSACQFFPGGRRCICWRNHGASPFFHNQSRWRSSAEMVNISENCHACNLYTIYTQSIHNLYTIYTQSIHNLYTIYTQSIHNLYTIYTQSMYKINMYYSSKLCQHHKASMGHQAPGWRRPRSFRRRPMRMQRTTGNLCLGFLNMGMMIMDMILRKKNGISYEF